MTAMLSTVVAFPPELVAMTVYWAAAVTVVIALYLLIALIRPEKF